MKTFASIYIGSYEVIMKIFEITKGKPLREIDCLKTQTQLVSDLYEKGSVSFDTTDKLCRVLLDMKHTMEMYHVDDYLAYSGATLHGAANELFVLEQIKLRTDLKVNVLSNSEHRFLGYKAVASDPSFEEMVKDSAVIVDVGGASLQITLFRHSKIVTTQHLMLGTVAMRENLKRLENAEDHVQQISEMIYKELDVFCMMFLQEINLKYMILLGDNVSALVRGTGMEPDGKTMKTEVFQKYLAKLGQQNVPGGSIDIDILEDNDGLLQAFVLLHSAIADKMDAKYVMVPGVAVNEGIAYDYGVEQKLLKSSHDFDEDVISAAWSIAKRYGSYQPHLKALERLSLQIFDTMKKYHGMGKKERVLMSAAAILHDCGKYISIAEASDCSYTIIMASEILGLTHKEREMVAMIVSFNRKPLMPYDELADRFTEEDYMTVVKLLAILKVANAMDRSHKQKFKNVKMSIKDRELRIVIESEDSIALEKGLFDEKGDFFESVFSIRPVMKERKILA